jgi:hypothetical protein
MFPTAASVLVHGDLRSPNLFVGSNGQVGGLGLTCAVHSCPMAARGCLMLLAPAVHGNLRSPNLFVGSNGQVSGLGSAVKLTCAVHSCPCKAVECY